MHPRHPQSLPLLLALTGAAGGLYYAKENGLLDGVVGVPAPAKVRALTRLRFLPRCAIRLCHGGGV